MADEIRQQRMDMEYSIKDPVQRARESIPPGEPKPSKWVSFFITSNER